MESAPSVPPRLRETLSAFGRPPAAFTPLTASEVADVVGCSRRSAYDRLDELVTRDVLATKKVGARARIWWRPPSEESDTSSAAVDRERQQPLQAEAAIRSATFTLDEAGHVDTWNGEAEQVTGYRRETIVGEPHTVFYTDEAVSEGTPEEILARAAAEGSVERRGWRVRADGTRFRMNTTLTALHGDDGTVCGYVQDLRDVADTDTRERDLERYETIVETIDDGVYVLDETGCFVEVNDAYVTMTGYDRETLLGSHCSLVVGDSISTEAAERSKAIADGDEKAAAIATEITRPDGSTLFAESRFRPLRDEQGTFQGSVGVVRDITERREREQELERYETIVETVADGVYVLDEERRFVLVNDSFVSKTAFSHEELLGAHASTVFVEVFEDPAPGDGTQNVVRVEEEVVPESGEPVTVETRFQRLDLGDGHVGRLGVVRDVTDRKRYEETLTALTETVRNLFVTGTNASVDRVVRQTATDVLGLPGVVLYRLDDDGESLAPVEQSAGIATESFTAVSLDDHTLVGRAFDEGTTYVVDDVRVSPFFSDGPKDISMRAGLCVAMGDHGVLVAGSREVGGLDDYDQQLVELLATNATAAYDRVEREERLERQREQLTALNELNAIVREITEALVRQSTREEIEAVVCDRLADSDSYLFSWIGEVDTISETVRLRTEAGVEGYLDDITISVDPDDPRSRGATGRAVETMEMKISRDLLNDPDYEPWLDHLRDYGFRSLAAIPITHEGTLYGTLAIYANRSNAFEGQERAVVGQLGTIIGHAIASIERKRALMSDEVLSIEYHIRDVLDLLDIPKPDGTISLDRTLPVGDGEYLVYGTASADAFETVATLVDRVPTWKDVSIHAEEPGVKRFELHLSEPPVISAVATQGGSIERAVIEDGDYRIDVSLPPGTAPRQITRAVRETYPDAEFVSQRHLTRTTSGTVSLKRVLTADLTERQRTVLEAAYFSGFFEWPRESTGEDVADSIGISSPTFHQHLRMAQRKLLDATLDDSLTARG